MEEWVKVILSLALIGAFLWSISTSGSQYQLEIRINGQWTLLGLFESRDYAEEYLDVYLEKNSLTLEDYRIIYIAKKKD